MPVRAILRATNTHGTLDSHFPATAKLLRDGSVLVGARVFDKSGKKISMFGETPNLITTPLASPTKTIRRKLTGNTRMDVHLSPRRLRAPYFVTARINTSKI